MKILQTSLEGERRRPCLRYRQGESGGPTNCWGTKEECYEEERKKNVMKDHWVKDIRLDVAIYFINEGIVVQYVTRREGYICVDTEKISMYCCYISPNISLQQ